MNSKWPIPLERVWERNSIEVVTDCSKHVKILVSLEWIQKILTCKGAACSYEISNPLIAYLYLTVQMFMIRSKVQTTLLHDACLKNGN